MEREMPRYQSHKTVWALKIKEVGFAPEGHGAIIRPVDDIYAPCPKCGLMPKEVKVESDKPIYAVECKGCELYAQAPIRNGSNTETMRNWNRLCQAVEEGKV